MSKKKYVENYLPEFVLTTEFSPPPVEIQKIADDATDADREFMKEHRTQVLARPMIQDEFWPASVPPDAIVVTVSFQGFAALDERFTGLAKHGGRSRIPTSPRVRLTLQNGSKMTGRDVTERVALKKAPKAVRDCIRNLGDNQKDVWKD